MISVTIPEESLRSALEGVVADFLKGDARLRDIATVKTSVAAAAFGLDSDVFLTLCKAHKITPVEFGPRLTRWRVSDLEALVTRCQTA